MILSKKQAAKNAFLYVFVLWMLYVSDSMLFALNNNRTLMSYAGNFLVCVGMILAFFLLIRRSLEIEFLGLLFVFAFLIISGVANSGSIKIAIKRVATLCLGFFVAKKVNTNKLIDVFCNIMVLIAVVSLVGYSFPNVFTSIGFLPRIVTSTREMESVSLFFTNIPIDEWKQDRNWGPFWEPGAYQAFLNIALIFTMFFRSKRIKHWWIHAIILIVAVVTTLSTTGYVALFLIFIAYLLDKRPKLGKFGFSKIIISIVGVAVVLYVLGESGLYDSVLVQKLTNEETSRYQFVRHGIQAFWDSPLFGKGANLANAIEEMAGYSVSFTNTVVANFAVFGLIPGIYVLVRYVKTSVSFKNITSTPATICLGIALFALLFGEYFMYSPIFAWLMFVDFGKDENCLCNEVRSNS